MVKSACAGQAYSGSMAGVRLATSTAASMAGTVSATGASSGIGTTAGGAMKHVGPALAPAPGTV